MRAVQTGLTTAQALAIGSGHFDVTGYVDRINGYGGKAEISQHIAGPVSAVLDGYAERSWDTTQPTDIGAQAGIRFSW